MITAAKDWFRAGSPWTIVFYLAFMAVWCVVLMPYGPLCIAVGFIFGFYQGLCIQLIALLVSNAALYGVGRHLLRDHVIPPPPSPPQRSAPSSRLRGPRALALSFPMITSRSCVIIILLLLLLLLLLIIIIILILTLIITSYLHSPLLSTLPHHPFGKIGREAHEPTPDMEGLDEDAGHGLAGGCENKRASLLHADSLRLPRIPIRPI
jgi:hypothetical protein